MSFARAAGLRTMIKAINVFTAEQPAGRHDVGSLAGSAETAMFMYDIAPGASSSPYHYEYEEEWLLVVDGTVSVRTPDGEQTLVRGDLARFPAGPAGAHKISNRGDAPARALVFSRTHAPAVSVYPDSNKLAVWPGGDGADDLIVVRDHAVDWSHGEEGWERAD